MNTDKITYKCSSYPPEIISYAVWLYHRCCLSFRDVEDLFVERGIIVVYEAIRQWCKKFGPSYAHAMKRRHHIVTGPASTQAPDNEHDGAGQTGLTSDPLVNVTGMPFGQTGSTNRIRIARIK